MLDVELVDAGIGHHEAQPVRHDRRRAGPSRTTSSDWESTASTWCGSLPVRAAISRARCDGSRANSGVEIAALGLGDDLLREDEDVPSLSPPPAVLERRLHERGQIVSRLDERDSRIGKQETGLHGGGGRHSGAKDQGRSRTGDPDAGARHLVAAVDADQHRGEGFGGSRGGENATVHAAGGDGAGEFDDRLAGLLVVAEDQHVATGAAAGMRLGGADVVEGGDHADPVTERGSGRSALPSPRQGSWTVEAFPGGTR